MFTIALLYFLCCYQYVCVDAACTCTTAQCCLATTCNNCPAGSTSTGGVSTTCIASAGYYMASGSCSSYAATACTSGKYYGSTGGTSSSVCAAVTAGYFASISGVAASSAATGQTACAQGYYSSSTSATSCTTQATAGYCAASSTTSVSGNTNCKTSGAITQAACFSGSYSSSVAGACTSASAGYCASSSSTSTSNNGNCKSTAASFQAACYAGSYSSGGSASCTAVTAGYFASISGVAASSAATGQTACSPGYYSSSTSATSCTTQALAGYCASSSATSTTGNSNCVTSGAVNQAACYAGSYSSGGSASCSSASAGYCSASSSASVSGNTNCVSTAAVTQAACYAGSYSSGGSASCTAVTAGYFASISGVAASSAATGQTACAQGYYSSSTSATSCTTQATAGYCAASSTTSVSGNTNCKTSGAITQAACFSGSYSSAVAGACTSASAGYCASSSSTSVSGNGNCKSTAASTQAQCFAGTYAASGSATCLTCSSGSTTNTLSSNGASTCTPCAAGSYSASSTVACQICAAGSVTNKLTSSGATSCVACSVGSYSPSSTVACQICSAGTTTLQSGSTSCTAYSCSSNCAAGSYCSGSNTCSPCPTGRYTSASSNSTSCTQCTAGNYASSTGLTTCRPCSAGTYSSSGQAQCTTCASGSVTDTLTSDGATTCTSCLEGTFSTSSIVTCANCTAGSYNVFAQQRACTLCDANTYSAVVGASTATVCQACLTNTYSLAGMTYCISNLTISSQPTSHPSSRPSIRPTCQPSLQPFSLPSSEPSRQPSGQPSKQPNSRPSTQPSRHPTMQPSRQPNSRPSSQPSRLPSSQPSMQPSRQPSSWPSMQPSSQPLGQPSKQPNSRPSTQPSRHPTMQPSRQPSSQPTRQPTLAPSTVLQQRVVVSISHYFTGLQDPGVFINDANASKILASTIALALNIETFFVNISSVSLISDTSTITGSRKRRRSLATSALHVTTKVSIAIPFRGTKEHILSSITSTLCSSSFVPILSSNMQSSTLFATGAAALYTSSNCAATTVSSAVSIVVTKSAPPSGRPSGRPSTWPTGQPSMQPTSYPTSHCKPGTITSGLHCSTCQGGTFSATYSAESCDTCPPGTFALAGSSSCTPCLQGFYSPDFGVSACAACPPSRTTPTIGSTSDTMCVNPVNNFALGGVTTLVVMIIGYSYVVSGRYERVAFLRKIRVTQPLKESYSKSTMLIFDRSAIAKREKVLFKGKKGNDVQKNKHVWLFLLLSLLLCSFMTVAIFVIIISSVFFKSLILYHGFNFSANITYIQQVEQAIGALADAIRAPDIIHAIFTPFTYIFYALSNLHIDLSSVNVTCLGATSSFELFFDVMILGAIIIVIKSEYQLFRGVTFPGVTNGYLNYAFMSSYAKLVKKKPMCWKWYTRVRYLIWTLIAELVGYTDIFQTSLQYLTSFVNIKSFVARNGIQHQFTAACDATTPLPPVFPGVFGIDSLLALLSTILAYMLVLPAIYEIGKILCPSLQKKIKFCVNWPASEGKEGGEGEENKGGVEITGAGVVVADSLANLESATQTNTLPEQQQQQQQQQKETKQQQRPYMRYLFKLQSLLSPDLLLATFASQWIKTISKALPKAMFTEKVDWQSQSTSSKDDKGEEDKHVQEEDKNQVDVKDVAPQVDTNQVEVDTEQRREEKTQEEKENKGQLPSYVKLCYFEYEALKTLVRSLPFVFRFFFNYLVFPLLVFFGLGHILTPIGLRTWAMILYKYFLFGQISIGYWTDETVEAYNILPATIDGRPNEFKGGMYEYSFYAERFEKLKQQEEDKNRSSCDDGACTLHSRNIDGKASGEIDNSESSIEAQDAAPVSALKDAANTQRTIEHDLKILQDYALILSCMISARCVLYQIVPEFTILTVFASTVSSSPFYVQSVRLAQRLPKLWIDNGFALAKEQEMHLEKVTQTTEKDTQQLLKLNQIDHQKAEEWIVVIRGVHICVTESRLVQNMLNLYRFCFTIGLLYSSPKAWMLSTLVIILPYAFIRSLYFVVLLGKFMDMTDDDLRQAFFFTKCASCPRREEESSLASCEVAPPQTLALNLDKPVLLENELNRVGSPSIDDFFTENVHRQKEEEGEEEEVAKEMEKAEVAGKAEEEEEEEVEDEEADEEAVEEADEEAEEIEQKVAQEAKGVGGILHVAASTRRLDPNGNSTYGGSGIAGVSDTDTALASWPARGSITLDLDDDFLDELDASAATTATTAPVSTPQTAAKTKMSLPPPPVPTAASALVSTTTSSDTPLEILSTALSLSEDDIDDNFASNGGADGGEHGVRHGDSDA